MIICECCRENEASVIWAKYGEKEKHLCPTCYKLLSKKHIDKEFLDGLQEVYPT